jgi:hypothetical protein
MPCAVVAVKTALEVVETVDVTLAEAAQAEPDTLDTPKGVKVNEVLVVANAADASAESTLRVAKPAAVVLGAVQLAPVMRVPG